MIRNLKILIIAAMALTAFGAISASGAQAAELHCSVQPCTVTIKTDGILASKQAHHVFIVKQGEASVSTTCEHVLAHGTSETKTFKTLTVTELNYTGCNIAGSPSTVKMNGCHYHLVVGGIHHATVQVQCPEGKLIEIKSEAECLITIGSTGVLTGGLTFKDAETNKILKTEVTGESTVTNIPAKANNKCPGLKEGAVTGEYTTGNIELTADEDKSPFPHASIWWE